MLRSWATRVAVRGIILVDDREAVCMDDQERAVAFADWRAMSGAERRELWEWNRGSGHLSASWPFPMFATSTVTIIGAITRRACDVGHT